MDNIRPDFEVCEKDISAFPPRYQNITCNIIFDVKMGENFRRKSQFVADGHRTKTPAEMTYLSLVSRESVRIALKIADFNDLDLLECDIQSVYLTVDFREWVWVVAGPEFGYEAGNSMLARKSLYQLKRYGIEFRSFLEETLDAMGYRPRYANPDLCLRTEVKPDGFEYYE